MITLRPQARDKKYGLDRGWPVAAGVYTPDTGGGVPVAPDGFQILLGQDGSYLTGADGAPLYGKAA